MKRWTASRWFWVTLALVVVVASAWKADDPLASKFRASFARSRAKPPGQVLYGIAGVVVLFFLLAVAGVLSVGIFAAVFLLSLAGLGFWGFLYKRFVDDAEPPATAGALPTTGAGSRQNPGGPPAPAKIGG